MKWDRKLWSTVFCYHMLDCVRSNVSVVVDGFLRLCLLILLHGWWLFCCGDRRELNQVRP